MALQPGSCRVAHCSGWHGPEANACRADVFPCLCACLPASLPRCLPACLCPPAHSRNLLPALPPAPAAPPRSERGLQRRRAAAALPAGAAAAGPERPPGGEPAAGGVLGPMLVPALAAPVPAGLCHMRTWQEQQQQSDACCRARVAAGRARCRFRHWQQPAPGPSHHLRKSWLPACPPACLPTCRCSMHTQTWRAGRPSGGGRRCCRMRCCGASTRMRCAVAGCRLGPKRGRALHHTPETERLAPHTRNGAPCTTHQKWRALHHTPELEGLAPHVRHACGSGWGQGRGLLPHSS